MRVVLEVVEGKHKGKKFAFDRHSTFMVGRAPKVHFQIPGDVYFSRHHFMIEVNPPRVFLRDLGSSNGTVVNGKKLARDNLQTVLKDGDVIHGGRTSLRVSVEGQQDVPEHALSASDSPGGADTAPTRAIKMNGVKSDTKVLFAEGAGSRGKALRCIYCGKLAEDTQLGDLAASRILVHVCKSCRDKTRTKAQPIPNYEILDELGRGTLGPVFRARRITTNRLVAVKPIPPHYIANRKAVKVFLREMCLGARLSHPNIVSVLELGEAGTDLWIAMELVKGLNAAELAERAGGKLATSDAVDIGAQILGALDYAHSHSLVHRDVKPTNILVTGKRGAYKAKLSDFGLMKNFDEAGLSGITRQGEVRGTVPFMPPEQVLDCRMVKPAGDIYGAGATLYWLLTGRYVYDFDARDKRGETKDPFLVILESDPIPIRKRSPEVPKSLARAIDIALRREPEDRYETAAQMAESLRAAAC